jgi:flagellar protein FlaG
MAENVAGLSSVAFINPDAHAADHDGQQAVRAVQEETLDAGRYRLTIEQEASGFVYKTLDRVTGEVIRQLPREEVLKMRESSAYGAGEVITTKV